MLAFLGTPGFGIGDERRVIGKHRPQIGDVVGSVGLDQRRRLDDGEQARVDTGSIELRPGDVVGRPVQQI